MPTLRRIVLSTLSAFALAAASCGSEVTYIGDPNKPLTMEMVYRSTAGTIEPCQPDGEIPIIQPPQGGKVIFIGARATNFVDGPVQIKSVLRDDCSDRIIAIEERPVILEAGDDGWAMPERPMAISNFSNLALCPSAAALRDLDGNYWKLELSLTDSEGRTASQTMRIRPICGEPGLADLCACECDADYSHGSGTCPADPAPAPAACE